MNQKLQKQVAREIIILFSALLIVGITYGIMCLNNKRKILKIDNLEEHLEIIYEETEALKVFTVSNKVDEFGIPIREKFTPSATHPNYPKYQSLVLKADSLTIEKADITSNILSSSELIYNVKNLSCIVFVLMYPLRFVLIILIWSIKKLRE
jgi:hypothetical protein